MVDCSRFAKGLKSKFISFDGVDCAGKSTQIALLTEFLSTHNIKYFSTREPGDTLEFGDYVSKIVREQRVDSLSQTLMLLGERNVHINNYIVPELNSGKVVICDRYHDSTIVYQGYGNGVDLKVIDSIKFLLPSITFVLHLDIDTIISRIMKKRKRDKIEESGKEYFERVINGYVELSKSDERYVSIDASQSIDSIHNEIMHHLFSRFCMND